MRSKYPNNEFISLPYGQSALELRARYEQQQLPDVDVMISDVEDTSLENNIGIFVDEKGHADDMLIDVGTLVWGTYLYDIEPDSSNVDASYDSDIGQLALDIVLDHRE